MNAAESWTKPYELIDRYRAQSGRVMLTGTQAIVRIVLDQARRDKAAGMKTAGFVSGYRGSPLGALDLELWRSSSFTDDLGIEFLPAVNEDLAATAMLGSQQVESNPDKQVDAVFGLWYGKGPGVDRSGDALKHGNAYGSSPHGGVLVVAGDDHGCVSSSMPHQSDVAFMAWFMPVLNPASVAEYLTFGEYGYALSRFSGTWVGFKAVSETVESAASVRLRPWRQFLAPDFTPPPTGLHYRWPDLPGPQIEERLIDKKQAVLAFAKANPIDRRIHNLPDAGYGIVTTGKAHLDLLEAMRLLGLDDAQCHRLGIDIYKVGMVWPLAQSDALSFVRGKREILVVEEKRGIIESQFKEYFYDYPGEKPERMVGKQDETGQPLIPWTGELSPKLLAPIIAQRLDAIFPGHDFTSRAARLNAASAIPITVSGATRTPYFCSGCPHNTSTRVPDGSQAQAGIGCHFMASWMDRETSSLIQMGGEGVNWVASSRFTGNGHIFQNLGEGTYYHSGSMAIRQAIAAGVNITYKILFNDAVAMTGGQAVDGPVSVQAISHTVRAEGVERIALVSDDPGKFRAADFPTGLTIHDRSDLDGVQRELREIKGVTVLIYEQTCASEKRRRRKRGSLPEPNRFVEINDLVCEGCGDCSTESNCLSVEPKATALGTKRQINQSACNKDFSCLNGYCPSFVTIEGGQRKRNRPTGADPTERAARLPEPTLAPLNEPFDLLVTGVGGTGVVTVGALIAMAAHLEHKGASVLDFTGFAQKFGPVLSFVRLAAGPEQLNQLRIEPGSADALIGCDAVVSSSPKASLTYRRGTRAIVNTAEIPTGDIVLSRDAGLRIDDRCRAIEQAVGRGNLSRFDANRAATRLMTDSVFANVMMLGYAWQCGLIPVALTSLSRAIELNGVAVSENLKAFAWGRLIAADPHLPELSGENDKRADGIDDPTATAAIIQYRATYLASYQNSAYARRYTDRIARIQQAEEKLLAATTRGSPQTSEPDARSDLHKAGSEQTRPLTAACARGLFMLMAIKDEYEVARLQTSPDFLASLRARYDGDWRLNYHFASPLLSRRTDWRGRPRKKSFGSWMRWPLRLLAAARAVRGTTIDPFSFSAERRQERALLSWYETLLDRLPKELNADNRHLWLAAMNKVQDIRGFGPVRASAADEAVAQINGLLQNAAADAGKHAQSPVES